MRLRYSGRSQNINTSTNCAIISLSLNETVAWLRTLSRISATYTAADPSSCTSSLCSSLLRRNSSNIGKIALELGSVLAKAEKRRGRDIGGVAGMAGRTLAGGQGEHGPPTYTPRPKANILTRLHHLEVVH